MNKTTDLALKVLAHLNARPANGSDLAQSIGTTTNYLPQIIKPLVVKGWVAGTSGPGGGYQLTVDPKELSVLEVVEAMEGVTDEEKCVLRGVPCPAPEPCALHDSWVQARDALLAELARTSVETTFKPAPTEGE